MDENKRKRGRPTTKQEIDITNVLDVAIKVFADNGFAGAQLKEIAQKAGIANSMLTYRFKGKEDLWKQAVTQLGGKLHEKFVEIDSYFKDLEGIAAMKAYTRQFIYFSAKHPEFYKIVFHEMCTKTERADWLVKTILTPIHQLFEKNADHPNAENLMIGGYPIANASSIFIGASNVFFIHSFQMEKMYGINSLDPKEVEKHADIVIDILFKGLEN